MIIEYSGTTVENYRTCAYLRDGIVLFDKRQQPKHTERRLFYDESFHVAAIFALGCARQLEHTPLILEGTFPDEFRHYCFLDTSEPFPVARVWKPKAEWRTLGIVFDKNLKSHFQELDPRALLP